LREGERRLGKETVEYFEWKVLGVEVHSDILTLGCLRQAYHNHVKCISHIRKAKSKISIFF
jgi:protein required for attachment to host cells